MALHATRRVLPPLLGCDEPHACGRRPVHRVREPHRASRRAVRASCDGVPGARGRGIAGSARARDVLHGCREARADVGQPRQDWGTPRGGGGPDRGRVDGRLRSRRRRPAPGDGVAGGSGAGQHPVPVDQQADRPDLRPLQRACRVRLRRRRQERSTLEAGRAPGQRRRSLGRVLGPLVRSAPVRGVRPRPRHHRSRAAPLGSRQVRRSGAPVRVPPPGQGAPGTAQGRRPAR